MKCAKLRMVKSLSEHKLGVPKVNTENGDTGKVQNDPLFGILFFQDPDSAINISFFFPKDIFMTEGKFAFIEKFYQ